MKALVLSTAIALGFAAPSFANEQLARGLGVDADNYTLAELVALQRAVEEDRYDFADFVVSGGSNTRGLTAAGADFARSQAEQDDDGPVGRFSAGSGTEIISTQSFGSGATDAGRAFAIEQARENDNWALVRHLESGASLNGSVGLN